MNFSHQSLDLQKCVAVVSLSPIGAEKTATRPTSTVKIDKNFESHNKIMRQFFFVHLLVRNVFDVADQIRAHTFGDEFIRCGCDLDHN